jgi:uncharacterized membrane-anchored protein YitT (DUF2179 family)
MKNFKSNQSFSLYDFETKRKINENNNSKVTQGLPRHNLLEDFQALVIGTLFASLGLVFFKNTGLTIGGTVGLAILGNHATSISFSLLFFVINIPFYFLAWKKMGWCFTLKTIVAIGLITIFSKMLPNWIILQNINSVFSAVTGGLLIGIGFIVLFQHRMSLGGFNILVLWCQERFGWRAGIVQMMIDGSILLVSWPYLDIKNIGLSIVAVITINFVVAVNYKPSL